MGILGGPPPRVPAGDSAPAGPRPHSCSRSKFLSYVRITEIVSLRTDRRRARVRMGRPTPLVRTEEKLQRLLSPLFFFFFNFYLFYLFIYGCVGSFLCEGFL